MLSSLLIAAASGTVWFTAIVLVDPHRRKKGSTRALLVSFVLGFASVPLVFLLYELAPDVVSGLGSPAAQDAAYHLLVVGPLEEFAKFFIFFLVVRRRRSVQEPLDAVLHAAAVALAFSLTENVMYGLEYGPDTAALRALVSTPGHLAFAGIWGFAYAALIHGNPARRPRDFVVLFFSIFPAALVHGLSNVAVTFAGNWWLLFDVVLFGAALGLLAWLRTRSPYNDFRLAGAAQAIHGIDLGLASHGDSYALHLRAALARVALGDMARSRSHIERCLGIRKGDHFAVALSGVIRVLQGETAAGEEALELAYPLLSWGQKRTLDGLARHVARSNRTANAYNEFQLSMWFKGRAGGA